MCRHRVRLILVGIGFILVLTACPPTKGVRVTGITVTPTTATLQVGQSLALEASVQPGNASQLVSWASDAAAVASVAGDGLVSGVSVGTASVTVTSVADVTRMATASITVVAAEDPDPGPGPGPDPDEGPLSARLIDEALARGEIDDETALLYQVFAAFGDTRLPTEYQGQASRTVMPGATMVERFDHVSPAAQAILAPFLLPPSAPGSWLDLPTVTQSDALASTQASRWNTIITDNDKVKVWWQNRFPADKATAETIAQAIDTEIWPVLTGLMQREPLSDAGFPNNGGDGRFDIYLVGIRVDGMAVPYVDCKSTPAYLLIGNRPRGLLPTLAHEFMHAIQFGYPIAEACDKYYWWMEASAVWAEDFVYSDLHGHVFHRVFQSRPHDPLNRVRSASDKYPYGAYMWPYFFTLGNSAFGYVVRDIWERMASASTLDAMDGALAGLGGFEAVWPRFALYNWNQVPVDNYQQWSHQGQLKGAAATGQSEATAVDLLGGMQRTFEIGTLPEPAIQPLSARYHHYTFPDDDVRSVYFRNGLTYELTESRLSETAAWQTLLDWPEFGVSHAHAVANLTDFERKGSHVWLIEKVAGEWRPPMDATSLPQVVYCRDTAHERLEELVVIVSNSNHDGTSVVPKGLPPLLHVTNVACHRWTGSLEMTETSFLEESYHIWADLYAHHDPLIPPPMTEYTITLRSSDLVFDRDPLSELVPAAFSDLPEGKWPLFSHTDHWFPSLMHGSGTVHVRIDATVTGSCWRHTLGGSGVFLVDVGLLAIHDLLHGPAERAFWLDLWTTSDRVTASTVSRSSWCHPEAWYAEGDDHDTGRLGTQFALQVNYPALGAVRLMSFANHLFEIEAATSPPFTIDHDGRTLQLETTLQEDHATMRIALNLTGERQE